MQAVMRETSGISELQRRKASPVHICCASELKAWLAVGIANTDVANAVTRPNLRNVVVMAASPLFDPDPFIRSIGFRTASRSSENGFVWARHKGTPPPWSWKKPEHVNLLERAADRRRGALDKL